MSLYINTNVASLNAQRNLGRSSGALARSFQRLSSGLRINSAKDDAAGLAISSRLTSQIRGLNQAVRNTNDGISLAQTAEGALQETTNILHRIRELAIQAANDSNSEADRASLDAEVVQLKEELDRIGANTTFNNQHILDGSFIQSFFHVGANAYETIGVKIRDARATALGRAAVLDTNVVTTNALVAGSVTIGGFAVRATNVFDDTLSTVNRDGSAIAKAAAINDATKFTGVKARALETVVSLGNAIAGGTLGNGDSLVINGEVFTGFDVQVDDGDHELTNQINALSATTGVIASIDRNSELVLTARDGRNIDVVANGASVAATGLATGVTTAAIELTSDAQFSIAGANPGFIGGVANQLVGVTANNAVSTVDVLSRDASNRTIDIVDRAIEQVSRDRAALGAIQNRMENTISNLSTVSENLSASRSRILDADFADETAQLTRNQILQQAGTSILAAANQAPQTALTLLG